ncbi:MAG: hypothetical protein HY814_02530 [Candidatus Riflebacteria bacterium]|nr:hypothetical protein [Candidatus Riflebacteria bacterium]
MASRTYQIGGSKVRVDGLIPWECERCHERVWPNSEVQRAREIIEIRLRKLAA